MRKMPEFLNLGRKLATNALASDQARLEDYQPLLGLWLIEIALVCNWPGKPPAGTLEGTFCDRDYMRVTGLKKLQRLFPDYVERNEEEDALLDLDLEIDDENLLPTRQSRSSKAKREDERRLTQGVTTLLKARRKELLEKGVEPDLPLFQNVERLGRLLHFNDAEKSVLTFAACISCFSVFSAAIMPNQTEISDGNLARILAALSGHPEEAIRKAIRLDSILITSGLVRIQHEEVNLEDKLELVRELRGVMLDQLASDDELSRRVLHQASAGSLTLNDFPHLARDTELLQDYLRGALAKEERGANVLFYGAPGTGKTEYAKALAAQIGLSLYEIGYADEDGDPIDGEQRLHSLNFCQRALHGKDNAALLFDEVEDVLPGKAEDGFFGRLMGESAPKSGKAWINRSLEDNPVPTLWITNNANIDLAYLRRFDYSLELRIPPRQVRARIAAEHLGKHAPNAAALAPLADLADLLPSQMERAARVASLSAHHAPERVWERVEMALSRSRALLGQSRKSLKPQVLTTYRREFLNTDANLGAILTGLQRQPQASFCLYGPPGTGKSLLARHIADELGKPLIVKRASDLLNKYVGGTEKRLAAMFEQARDEDAVLLLDEADSFITERAGAMQSWEVTQTNELLTQLESFEGLFFATTNHLKILDSASLRRFSHKIRFDFLKPEQRWKLFTQEFERQGCDPDEAQNVQTALARLDQLTPGDFAVVLKNQRLLGSPMSAEQFVKALAAEVAIKQQGKGRPGFM